MAAIVTVDGVRKVYAGGFEAVKRIDLAIEEGEVLALLGPNGAGKTTLISMICGLSTVTEGRIAVGGHDVVRAARAARELVGLVPQDLTVEGFETVINTVRFTRGLFGKPRDDAAIERILADLGLIDKRDDKIITLSGGMKRRVMIAKALAHEPRVLFLDEPTAGVDVTLRREMWAVIGRLKAQGVTIILTTHYIEEAEAMADRVGVIDKGALLLVEDKTSLMARMGRKSLRVALGAPLAALPDALAARGVALGADGRSLVYDYDTNAGQTGITDLLAEIRAAGLHLADLETHQSSLEEIFVGLVGENRP